MTTREAVRLARTPVTLVVLLLVLGYGGWWGYQRVVRHSERASTAAESGHGPGVQRRRGPRLRL